MVAALLHLGNVTFGYDANRQIAVVDETTAAELEVAARLLQVPVKQLSTVLVQRVLRCPSLVYSC